MTENITIEGADVEDSEAIDPHHYVSVDPSSLFYGCPRYINIGSMRVEISIMDDELHMMCGTLGYTFPDQGRIALCNTTHPHVLANTALHEIIHNINRNRGIGVVKDEEFITEQMATGLCDLRVLNPEFFSWWEALLNA